MKFRSSRLAAIDNSHNVNLTKANKRNPSINSQYIVNISEDATTTSAATTNTTAATTNTNTNSTTANTVNSLASCYKAESAKLYTSNNTTSSFIGEDANYARKSAETNSSKIPLLPKLTIGDESETNVDNADDVFSPLSHDGHYSRHNVHRCGHSAAALVVDGHARKMAQSAASPPFYQTTNTGSLSKVGSGSHFQPNTGKIAMRGRLFAGRRTERLIEKDGSCSVVSKNVSYSQNSFYRDIFTSLLDMRWRYNMVVFVFVFVGSWFFFAVLWWMVAFFHGDLPNDEVSYGSNDTRKVNFNETVGIGETTRTMTGYNTSVNHSNSYISYTTASSKSQLVTQRSTNDDMINVPCVDGVNNFLTALLFSVETQQTVGYGTRNLNSHCTSATILLVVQACMGILLQSLMTGVVYSKLSRPKHRARTMMFSKFAVICQRDDQYCLLFRVGDTRKSYLIGTSIRVLLIKSKDECSFFSNFQHSLDLEMDQDAHDSSILLIWPVTVVHKIDENSPLWNVSVEDLFTAKFEIVVVLQGTIEHTGMTAQLCTSYLPSEILWGHRLAPLLTYQNGNGKYEIEFSEFHKVIPDKNMPECSAREFADRKKQLKEKPPKNDLVSFATIFKRQGSSLWPRVLKMLKKDSSQVGVNKDETDSSNNPENADRSVTPDNPLATEKRFSFKTNKRQSIDIFNKNHHPKHSMKTTRSLSLKHEIDETKV